MSIAIDDDYVNYDIKRLMVVKKIVNTIQVNQEHWLRFKKQTYAQTRFLLKTRAVEERDRLLETIIKKDGFVNMAVFSEIVIGEYGMKNSEDFFNWVYYRLIAFMKFHQQIGLRKDLKKKEPKSLNESQERKV